MDRDIGPNSAFVVPPVPASDGFNPYYPYHVLVLGMVVFRTRISHDARDKARCVRGQLWRTPVSPRFPSFCVCDFEVEDWCAAAGGALRGRHQPTGPRPGGVQPAVAS
jgi:hypothetical protein